MIDEIKQEFETRLRELDERVHAKIMAFKEHGVLHAADREAAVEQKLRELQLARAAQGGVKPMGDLAADIEILKLTFERWLARIDKASLS
jgi:hypothetical protein